jgi:hypothetical protein
MAGHENAVQRAVRKLQRQPLRTLDRFAVFLPTMLGGLVGAVCGILSGYKIGVLVGIIGGAMVAFGWLSLAHSGKKEAADHQGSTIDAMISAITSHRA